MSRISQLTEKQNNAIEREAMFQCVKLIRCYPNGHALVLIGKYHHMIDGEGRIYKETHNHIKK